MKDLTAILPDSITVDAIFSSEVLQKLLSDTLLDPVSEFLSRPQKNFRSQLVELGYLFSLKDESTSLSPEIRSLLETGSSIVELIHSGSLIVDDIQDLSPIRRSRPSLHVVHGIPLALNAGNWLYFWALERIKALHLNPVMTQELTQDIVSLMMKAHAGQAVDLGTRIDLVPQENVRETAMASIELKSGTLMSLALRIGASIAGRSQKTEELFQLGSTLGVLLQIYDDIGNFFTNTPKRYEDLKLRRPSWIWVMAADYSHDTYETFIDAVNSGPEDEKLQRWISENDFRQKLERETELFRSLCEISWECEWKKTHPQTMKKLMEMNKKLEKAYV